MAEDTKTPLLRQIQSPRLNLIAAASWLIDKDIAGHALLERALGVRVPESWPPDLYGPRAMHFTLTYQADAADQGWSFWYLVTRGAPEELIGVCGFKGWPDESGSVEIAYSILAPYQRQGFASEAVQRLTGWAFSHHNVQEVCAETLPHLVQSIGVLEKNGYMRAGAGSEAGVIRYAVNRSSLI